MNEVDTLRHLLAQVETLTPGEARQRLARYLDPLPPPELAVNVVHALAQAGDREGADRLSERLIRHYPSFAPGWARRSERVLASGSTSDAIALAARAVALDPQCPFSRLCHAIALRQVGQVTAATRELSLAVQLAPDHAPAWSHYGLCLSDQFQHGMAMSALRRAVDLAPEIPLHWSNWLMSMQYDPTATSETLRSAAEAFSEQLGEVPRDLRPAPGDQIRVGYLSPDIGSHPVGHFLLPVLREHNHEHFAVTVYADNARRDHLTAAVARDFRLIDVSGEADEDLATRIRHDGIDVLVDLAGHTAGNRLPMLARRIAPVQISWLGYYGSTGLRNIDAFVLGEAHCTTATPWFFAEPVRTVPGTHFSNQPPPYLPEVAPAPADHPRLGCFNNTAKLHGEVLACWAEILRAVPAATLTLVWKTLADPDFCGLIRSRFANHGVDPARIILHRASDHQSLLARYNEIDLALDPFPFGGGMTTFEALMMGVPVVTLSGERPCSRQGVAILSQLGLETLCTTTSRRYVETAVQLVADTTRRRQLAATLRSRLQRHNSEHAPRIAAGLEAIYVDCLARR